MNQAQIMGLVRTLLTMFGSILVARGVIESGQLNTDVDIIVTAVGGLVTAGSLVWSLWSKTKANTIAAAASLSNVKQIVTDQPTADKVPSMKVVGPAN